MRETIKSFPKTTAAKIGFYASWVDGRKMSFSMSLPEIKKLYL